MGIRLYKITLTIEDWRTAYRHATADAQQIIASHVTAGQLTIDMPRVEVETIGNACEELRESLVIQCVDQDKVNW